MISDLGPNLRELAWRRTKNAWAARKRQSNKPRFFKIPELVVDCKIDYNNMINWKNVKVTELTFTINLTDSEFDTFILDKTVFDLKFSHFIRRL